MDTQCFYVYILCCENGSYYTGYTTDLKRRYREHARGTRKSKFTRSFKPLAIAQFWTIDSDKRLAMRVEKHIKKLTRKDKERLILRPELLLAEFPAIKHK
jgi:putative endonuclease